AARRDILAMIQTLCQAAGLKLHAVTPKLFGIADAVARAHQPEPSPLTPKQLSAVLTIGHRWAELCFFKGNRLLQAQALAKGQPLPLKALDPLKPEPKISASLTSPGDFAGAVGLATLWGAPVERPINLASPKRSSAPVSVTRQRALVYGVAAAVLAIFLVGL